MMRQLALPFIAVAFFAGCATVDTNTEPKEEKEFVTGSNIPKRDRSSVSVYGREALEAVQRSSGGPTTKGSENPR
jgi:uncharacterized protein YceK